MQAIILRKHFQFVEFLANQTHCFSQYVFSAISSRVIIYNKFSQCSLIHYTRFLSWTFLKLKYLRCSWWVSPVPSGMLIAAANNLKCWNPRVMCFSIITKFAILMYISCWQLETFKRQLMQSLNDDNASVRFRYSASIYIFRGFHHFFLVCNLSCLWFSSLTIHFYQGRFNFLQPAETVDIGTCDQSNLNSYLSKGMRNMLWGSLSLYKSKAVHVHQIFVHRFPWLRIFVFLHLPAIWNWLTMPDLWM